MKFKVGDEPVKVTWPPCLSTFGDKRYAISGNVWIEVPSDTAFDDLHRIMSWEAPEAVVPEPDQSWEVQGSKGNKYAVRLSKGVWSCSCPGYSFRRKCRHIEGLKDEVKPFAGGDSELPSPFDA